jgi:hypothetical protein
VSSFCLVLCVLFTVLLVQSYRSSMAVVLVRTDYPPPLLEIWVTHCSRGLVRLQYQPKEISSKTKWRWFKIPDFSDLRLSPYQNQHITTWKGMFGFGWSISRFEGDVVSRTLTFPIWMPTVVCGLLTVLSRSKPHWQFGLRDLLAVTTAAALIIGPLAFWLRAISS